MNHTQRRAICNLAFNAILIFDNMGSSVATNYTGLLRFHTIGLMIIVGRNEIIFKQCFFIFPAY